MKDQENNLIRKAYEEIKKKQHLVKKDPYRLKFHIMPPVGLLNDPNGWIEYKGRYHLFYQWNPFKTAHGAKFWGHYSSEDLVHWEIEPIALAPSDWYDKNGCYSGSAIEHQGKMYLFYTGNVKDENGNRETYQCLAISDDGVTFEKHGPVIHLPEGYTAHFRDPKVWKHKDKWFMIIGAQTVEEKGVAVLFSSEDLWSWKHIGPIAGNGLQHLEDFGYMWECPDLFSMGDKDVLIVSPQGLEPKGDLYQNIFQTGYLVGKLDYHTGVFKHGSFIELDRGFDFYAPQSTLDHKGRRVLFGWMGMADNEENAHPTVQHEWVHALTLPRELVFQNDKLYQKPVSELTMLRDELHSFPEFELEGVHIALPGVEGIIMELNIDQLQVDEKFEIQFRHAAIIQIHPTLNKVSLGRKKFNSTNYEYRHCSISNVRSLDIFLDTSSIEVFINGGEEVFSARYYPNPENEEILFSGKAAFHLKKWDLRI